MSNQTNTLSPFPHTSITPDPASSSRSDDDDVNEEEDAVESFHDVTERTYSFASVSNYTFYEATERTSSCVSFYDAKDVSDTNINYDRFCEVDERPSPLPSSRYSTPQLVTDDVEPNHNVLLDSERLPISYVTSTSTYGSINNNKNITTEENGREFVAGNGALLKNDTDRLIVQQQNNSLNDDSTSRREYKSSERQLSSSNRAQLLSTLILLFYGIALVPSISLVSQYLTVRWRLEGGHNATQVANSSTCDTNTQNRTNTFEDDLSAKVSTETTYYNYVISATSAITCLFLGAYADIIGRRIIILSPAFTAVLHFVIIICIMRFDLDTNYFYISSTVIGLGGSFYAMLIGVFTVTADVNDVKNNRVLWLALQMCITSICLALGNIGLGYVIKYIGFYQAGIMLECFAILTFLIALLFMPETLPKERKYNAVKASLNPMDTVGRVFRIYTTEGTRRNRMCLWLCLALFFFAVIPDLQLIGLDTIYQLHQPLCWDSTQIGYYGAIQTGGKKLAGTVLFKALEMKGWIKIEKLAMIVCLFQAGSMVLEALLQHSWQMYLVPVIGTPGVITIPVIRGIMSFLVGTHNLGALFASIGCIETLCSLASSTSINRVYTATVDIMPGAVYFLMAAFAIITFLLFIPFFSIYDDPVDKNKDENEKRNRT